MGKCVASECKWVGGACAEVGRAVIQSWYECEVIGGSSPSEHRCDVVILLKGQEVTVSLGLLTVREGADLLSLWGEVIRTKPEGETERAGLPFQGLALVLVTLRWNPFSFSRCPESLGD